MTRKSAVGSASALLTAVLILSRSHFVFSLSQAQLRPPQNHVVSITNDSGFDVILNWIHPFERTQVKVQRIKRWETFFLRTHIGHEFQFQQLQEPQNEYSSSTCEAKVAGPVTSLRRRHPAATSFVVNENSVGMEGMRTELTVGENLSLLTYNDTITETTARRGFEEMGVPPISYDLYRCQTLALNALEDSVDDSEDDKAMNSYIDCAMPILAQELELSAVKINELFATRFKTALALRKFTCSDGNLVQASQDVSSHSWFPKEASSLDHHVVHVKLDHPSSSIHVIENFITQEECQAIEAATMQNLNVSHTSEHTRELQTTINIPLDTEPDNVVYKLSKRVYEYTNSATGFNLSQDGQESLMVKQSEGLGQREGSAFLNTPHCDGAYCNGLPHRPGSRVASMIMYCDVPSTGGTVNFGQAGVQVKPQKGSAVFFTYVDPSTLVTDTGLSSYSKCPAVEGKEMIVTQRMRLGVDERNPWDSFNSRGIRVSDTHDQ